VVQPVRATTVLLVMLGFFLWLAYYLFASRHLWIAVFLPTATLTTNYAAIVSYRFFFEEREKKKVRGAFQQYLAPGLITQLLKDPGLLRLGGEEKALTAMFSDIRGFTTISEGLTPGGLVELLNEYLSVMTDIVFLHWGTLDKYIGDAIVAFWGAPYPQSDHALRACRAALDMLKGLEKLNAGWQARGMPTMRTGVGINSGPMLVGNMGSNRRFNYTIMGDNVNLASRLEGLNKEFKTRIIVSESTFQNVSGQLLGRELDLIRVKGKTKPVKIFELLSTMEERTQYADLISRFQEGLEAYRSARWEAAAGAFEDLQRDYPHDGPADVFLHRCRDMLEKPPEGVWDGVYVMHTK
jgi:adenylate cyclase